MEMKNFFIDYRASIYGSKNILFFSILRYARLSEGEEEDEVLFATLPITNNN